MINKNMLGKISKNKKFIYDGFPFISLNLKKNTKINLNTINKICHSKQ